MEEFRDTNIKIDPRYVVVEETSHILPLCSLLQHRIAESFIGADKLKICASKEQEYALIINDLKVRGQIFISVQTILSAGVPVIVVFSKDPGLIIMRPCLVFIQLFDSPFCFHHLLLFLLL